MLLTRNWIWMSIAAIGAALVLASPAAAKTVYSWITDDGVYAFTDDSKQIPTRYAEQVERRTLRSLPGYSRYTPTPVRDRKDYLARMPEHLDRLRAAAAETEMAPRRHHRRHHGAGGEALVLNSGRYGSGPGYVLPTGGRYDDDLPVVIETVRSMPKTGNATRSITVVRRGDKVIAVSKPQLNDRPLKFFDEAELDDDIADDLYDYYSYR